MKKIDSNLKEKAQAENVKRKNKVQIYYSFLTIILLLLLVQTSIGAFLNITKSFNYRVKTSKMKQLNEKAQAENTKLKNEIKDFNNLKSLEAIARNNLKMAEKDEVLVIISNKENVADKDNSIKEKLLKRMQ